MLNEISPLFNLKMNNCDQNDVILAILERLLIYDDYMYEKLKDF